MPRILREERARGPDDEGPDMVPHELSDSLWYEGDAPLAERYEVFFELYRAMPMSANCMYAADTRGLPELREKLKP